VGSFPNQATFRDFPRTDADVPDTALVGLFSSRANELRKVHTRLIGQQSTDRNEITEFQRHSSSPRVSEKKAQLIAGCDKQGQTVYELAERFRIHRVTVSEVLAREGVSMRRRSPTDKQIDEMVELFNNGFSLKRVGERIGFNASTVLKRLNERGVSTTKAQGRSQAV
jgi:hypothetical protein